MRYAFARSLLRLAKKDKRILLLTGDLGYTVFEEFATSLPAQFYNLGVDESSIIKGEF